MSEEQGKQSDVANNQEVTQIEGAESAVEQSHSAIDVELTSDGVVENEQVIDSKGLEQDVGDISDILLSMIQNFFEGGVEFNALNLVFGLVTVLGTYFGYKSLKKSNKESFENSQSTTGNYSPNVKISNSGDGNTNHVVFQYNNKDKLREQLAEQIRLKQKELINAYDSKANETEIQRIKNELEQLNVASHNLDLVLKQTNEFISGAKSTLQKFSDRHPSEQLNQAIDALANGDFTLAQQQLKDIVDEPDDDIRAEAAYQLAELYELPQLIDYDQALHYYRKAYHLAPDNLVYISYLANMLYKLGLYKEAEPFTLKVVELSKQLGENHSDYASSLNNLAGLYQSQGEYEQALPLFQKALEIRKEVLGEKHPDYATSLNNLAGLYDSQGEYEQALPLYQQALGIRKEVLGKNHPDYATSLNNLAGLYESQGEYEQALPLYQQALGIRKEVLGENHPDYANSLNNFAELYRKQGEFKKALPLYQQALRIRKEVFGKKHPDYAASLNNLAALYYSQGEYEQALPLYQQALEIRREVFGENHPSYANSLNNLAGLYESQGEYEQALPLYQQALEIRKEVLGENHPNYATSLSNLAVLYKSQKAYEQALPLYQQALEILKYNFPCGHPNIDVVQGNYREALERAKAAD